MAKQTVHITTSELKASMSKRWSAPEHALIWEVGDATGGRQNRNADAVIMGLWPSRGIHLEGVEIKTHRSDWLRELKIPAKAEAVSRYCDRWWIHATPGVVKDGELPVGWGLRTFDGRSWKTEVEADLKTPEPVTREFLAALLRRTDQQETRRAAAMAEAMLEEERAKIDARVDALVVQRTRNASAMASIAEEFHRTLGLDPAEMIRNGEVVAAARMTAAFLRQDLHDPWGGLSYMIRNMRDLIERTSDVMREVGLEPPPADKPIPRTKRSGMSTDAR